MSEEVGIVAAVGCFREDVRMIDKIGSDDLRLLVRNKLGYWKRHNSRRKRIVGKKFCSVICPKYGV